MGNESSTHNLKTTQSISSDKRNFKKGNMIDKRSKSVLSEQNRTDSSESENGIVNFSTLPGNRTQNLTSNNLYVKKKNSSGANAISSTKFYNEKGVSSVEVGNQQLLSVPSIDQPYMNIRKGSYSDGMYSLDAANLTTSRRRSRSLCAQQLKNDCQSMAQSQNSSNQNNNSNSTRRSSNGVLPSLTRLRIQQCYKNARKTIGHLILKRACSLRSEIKMFISYLTEEKVEEIATNIYNFITDSVNNMEDPEKIAEISHQFGGMYAQLCNSGFRPEFFSTIADASIAECVRLDGGAHKRCETLLAWSQLMAVMFSGVRDGYYVQIRAQRRSSLPQHRQMVAQTSIEIRNSSSENDA